MPSYAPDVNFDGGRDPRARGEELEGKSVGRVAVSETLDELYRRVEAPGFPSRFSARIFLRETQSDRGGARKSLRKYTYSLANEARNYRSRGSVRALTCITRDSI